ncbi:MAG: type III-A CRISPR-associated protein Csm2 [Acidobacteria bacterium]|nr:type III-A CRISPR-associated protein Csm2 [Acidobacteriota bacterium]
MNEQEQDQAQKGRRRDRRRRGGGGGGVTPQQQEERKGRALEKFKTEIADRSFADDAIMRLSKDLGESMVRSQRAQARGESKENAKAQVRKFYHLVRVTQGTSPEVSRVKLRTLQAQTAYAVARRTLSEDFKDFIDTSVKKILNTPDSHALEKTLSEFVTFFESFFAYYYYQLEMDRSQQGGKRR